MADDSQPPATTPDRSVRFRWKSLSDGLLVSLVFSVTFLYAAYILRGQRESGWKVLLVVAAVGVLFGGAVAGRHRRTPAGATSQGLVVGALTGAVTTLADVLRYVVLGKSISSGTTELWVSVMVAWLIMAPLGAILGRRLYRIWRSRKAHLG